MNSPHLVLARHISLELVSGEGPKQRVPANLRYDARDPYAVTLLIGDPSCSIEWTFARELLDGGLRQPCGDGDVHVWPIPEDGGREVLLIELVSPAGEALLQASPRDVQTFLALTHVLVAPGEESDHLDIDGLVGALLAV